MCQEPQEQMRNKVTSLSVERCLTSDVKVTLFQKKNMGMVVVA